MEQYRSILATELDRCKVLAFSFGRDSGPEMYHYDLMTARVGYHLFDHVGRVAYVVIPDDPSVEALCAAIAGDCGGVRTRPDLR